MTAPPSIELRCYRFVCPDCGTSDHELGHLGTESDMHCVVCLMDHDSYVRLRRWHEAEVASHTGVALAPSA